jgi:DnaK suppressor protein
MPRFTRPELDAIARRLQERRRVLIAEIREQLAVDDDEHSASLSAQFDDLDPHDDRAVGDWVRDVAISQAARDTRELDDIGGALKRIDDGTYGECIDCGEDIPRPRLDANPSAARCIPCQEKIEAREGGVRTAL